MLPGFEWIAASDLANKPKGRDRTGRSSVNLRRLLRDRKFNLRSALAIGEFLKLCSHASQRCPPASLTPTDAPSPPLTTTSSCRFLCHAGKRVSTLLSVIAVYDFSELRAFSNLVV